MKMESKTNEQAIKELTDEKKELDVDLNVLNEFIADDYFQTLENNMRIAMKLQQSGMTTYSEALRTRIEIIKNRK